MRHTADSIFDQTLVGSVICRQCRLLWTAFWVFATLKTCQPCLNFHLHSANTETQVYTKISVFAHVLALALSQKQAVILSSACVCAVDWQHWIVVTVDGLQPFYPPPPPSRKAIKSTFVFSRLRLQIFFKSSLTFAHLCYNWIFKFSVADFNPSGSTQTAPASKTK